eukprot:CAMPEP_0118919528 /NCGR_PEP_ID=MMETSP1166-20130328/18605_1 /TAXON_ID=1104430 /ORGANISM="Chrysoreinhardia sp, Strain CCMP3193" /LENGTH=59 /DNA_ID=CAMNT_0006860059 /DNA_START=13 /DNA_END=189 /DNA_ORIENTATION=+
MTLQTQSPAAPTVPPCATAAMSLHPAAARDTAIAFRADAERLPPLRRCIPRASGCECSG